MFKADGINVTTTAQIWYSPGHVHPVLVQRELQLENASHTLYHTPHPLLRKQSEFQDLSSSIQRPSVMPINS